MQHHNCYICFEPTDTKVCTTCELGFAHTECITKLIMKTNNYNCTACKNPYQLSLSRRVILVLAFKNVYQSIKRFFRIVIELMMLVNNMHDTIVEDSEDTPNFMTDLYMHRIIEL